MINLKSDKKVKTYWMPKWLSRLTRRVLWLNLTIILVMMVSLLQGIIPFTMAPEPVSAHNLQTRMVYMFFDPTTQACLDARLEGTLLPEGCAPLPEGWAPGDPLLQDGDQVGVIIKVVPRDGTTTGVGGHIDFYVPNGVEVVDVGYVIPDGAGDYEKVAMKGQSPIAIGTGPVGAKTTAELIGLTDIYNSPVSSLSSTAVDPVTGLHLGTIAGVYGDTGIFYATDPDTAYGSWQAFTGHSTINGCGSLAFNPDAQGETLVNNSGDTVIPCNKWDAEQLMAWGVKGGTFGQSSPIVDYGDGRGNAPWGFASGVAGPQSGYAWQFNWDEWNSSAKTAADMRAAMSVDEIGPWQRIQYTGDQISYDNPGLVDNTIGYASRDAGELGVSVGDLPPTTSQTDTTSPKAIRWAVGQLTQYRPEYAWVKFEVNDATAGITNSTGCPDLKADTFGGDAGGTDNGKDHLWRYYEPTEVSMNLCLAAGKPSSDQMVKSGDIIQYPVKVYNLQAFPLTNVVVTDTLGSGLSFISAVPAQNTGPNPLVWNVGTLLPGQKFESLVTVKATSTGFLDNCVTISSDQLPPQTACDTTVSGLYPYLVPSKTVNVSGVAPGGTVIYELLVKNIGTGPTGSPVTIREYLPEGFTYDPSYAPIAFVNGALVTPTVGYSNPNEPVFVIPTAIQSTKQLTISFQAKISPDVEPGEYCNSFSATQNGVPVTTGSAACVNVAGGKIGDTIWRDWNGDGLQDVGEEGIEGVTVELYASDGITLLQTTTTDVDGKYYFNGLLTETYVVKVNGGITLTGYTQTYDPDSSIDNMHSYPLTENEQYLMADFGYMPTGTATIGDKVFEDIGNDGVFTTGTDIGIANVTVWLYEDTDGDGLITEGVDALVATTVSDANGDYLFSGLAEGYDYLVQVDQTDPDIQAYFDAAYGSGTPSMLSTPDFTSSLNLAGSDLDNDFGFWKVEPASIGDQLFIDLNGNGLFDPGETPIAGVTVNLYRDDVLIATTVSGSDGTYLFENLGPGNYTIKVDTSDPDIPGGYFAAIRKYDKTLNIGEQYLDADFPFVTLISKTVNTSFASPGDTLTFDVFVNYPGGELLSDVTVRDFLPYGTNFLAADYGGTLESFTSTPGIAGVDAGSAGDGTVTLSHTTGIEDTWLEENSPDRNYGAAVDLRVDPETSRPEHIILSFIFPTTLPDDAVVTSATLGLTKLSGNTVDIVVHQVTNEWVEGTLNGSNGVASWNDRLIATPWDTAGGDYSEDAADPIVSSGAATGLRSWSVAHIVQNWIDGQPNYGFLLKHPLENLGNNQNVFASSENGTVSSRPTLIFNYTSTARPATSNLISVSPDVIAIGSPVTVTMTLTSSEAVNNVVPSGLAVNGGSATCSGPIPASLDLAANVSDTFTWSCIPSNIGEFTFSATASNGTVNFRESISNSLLASPNGESQYVVWELGSNEPGNTGVSAQDKYLYAFRGDDKLDFWLYNLQNSTWNNPLDPANTPAGVTIKEGGSLTNDDVRYIYALRGDSSRVFLRYDALTDTWDDINIADLPASTNKTVNKGGALVYLDGYVYAFLGNDSAEFWRYDVSGNNWEQMTDAPAVINEGGALTTDGSNIYAMQGKKQKLFWRYNVATNTWTSLAPTLDNIGKGGSLVFANGAIYALRGDGQKTFYRYSIAGNTWTRLTDFPQNVNEGGALAFDGSNIYALRGNSKEFYRYDFTTQVWTRLSDVSDNVKWGGALTFLATGDVSRVRATATPTLVSGVSQVTVRMTTTSEDVINDITALTPTYTTTGGVTATLSAATLVSPDDDISGVGDPVIYEWIATVTPGTMPGEITFTTTNSLGGSAQTNSVIVSPILSYQVIIDEPAPAVIYNTAVLNETAGTFENVPSNTTETATTASIGDFVWTDLNGDGVQDAGEYGVPGIKVYVDSNDNGVWDPGEPYDVTDANGYYRIFGLEAGSYTVRTDAVTFPENYTPTTPGSLSVTITAGEQYDDADFGLQPPPPPELQGSIGDYLWLDANNDGFQDSDEVPLEGITVRLYRDLDNNGVIDPGDPEVEAVLTDADGFYTFDGLPFADYIVLVDQTSSVTSPYDLLGSYTLGDAMNPTYDKDGGLDNQTLVSVTSTTPITDVDFGYNWAGTIGDYVWYDTNINGIPDTGEPPIEGAVVLLYVDQNGDGILDPFNDVEVGFTITDANGYYSFDNLPPGDYLVDVYEDSITQDGVRDVVPTTDNVISVSLSAGETVDTADFGYFEGARVEGHVFHDDNRNTVFESGEDGLAGIKVTLTGTDMFGSYYEIITYTDANGHYFFIVPEGDYTVTYATAETTALGYPDATTPTSISFHAYPGEDWHPTFDFGVDYPGLIGDWVWNDENGDGVQDVGELGVPGVTVDLYQVVVEGGWTREIFLDTTVTDANGNYLFEGLGDGNYIVKVNPTTVPTGFVITYDENDGTTNPDHETTVTISGGNEHLTADFGYSYPMSYPISGNVFNDLTNLGVKDGTDPGLAGITVYLYDSTGTTIIATTTTDMNGDYLFPGNPDGSYLVKVDTTTLPSTAFYETYESDGSINNAISVVIDGAASLNNDFGYHEYLGSISGSTCIGDGDGFCEEGEDALRNVTINLIYAGKDGILGTDDDELFTTATDNGGNYSFSDLEPGLYQVQEINPPGYISLADADGGNPDNITVVIDFGPDGIPNTADDRLNWLDRDFEDALGEIGGFIDPNILETTVDAGGSAYFVQEFFNTGSISDRANLTVYEIPEGWEVIIYRYPNGPDNGVYPGIYSCVNPCKLVATESSIDPSGYQTLDNNDTINAANDTGGDGIPDSGNIDPSGSTKIIVQVTIPSTTMPGTYALRERGSSNNQWLILKESTPTLAYNDESVYYDEALKIVVVPGAVLGDRVWLDENSDGIQDAGEAGIANVKVTATWYGQDGVLGGGDDVEYTTWTDINGEYLFTDLPGGIYDVSIDITTLSDGLDVNPTYDYDGIGTMHTANVTLTTGEVFTEADFGYNWSSTSDVINNTGVGAIGDRIWVDADGDGRQDPGEPGLGGVTVNLYSDPDGDGVFDTLVATTTTAPDGSYIFDNIAPDAYVIEVDLPTGYTLTGDPDYPNMPCPSEECDNKTTTPILLAPGDVYLNADFGYLPDVGYGATIGDKIWLDANVDGIQNVGEPGIANVTVALIDDLNGNGIWDDGEPIIATTYTSEYGLYQFTGVPVGGDYLVWVNDIGNVLADLTPTYDDNGIDTPNISAVTNLPVEGNNLQDFGYTPTVQAPDYGLIGDTIFLDRDGDGLYDFGEGLGGITIELYASDGVTLLATTTTDENGKYYFGGLGIDTTYIIKVDTTTLPNDGVGLTNTVDPNGGGDSMSQVTITSGDLIHLDQDFGYAATNPNTISGTVWKDSDADGYQDPEEVVGLAGVTIDLLDVDGNIIATTTTDASGNYSFDGLPDGTYYVDVTDEHNILDGYWKSICPSGSCGLDGYSQSDPYEVIVSGGVTDPTADFGYYRQPASVGDWIFYDENWNGIQDPEDITGIPGVKVTLTISYPDGTQSTLVTYTDAEGYYSFGNLLLDENYDGLGTFGADGTEPMYTITVETPDDYLVSPSNQGSDDTVDSDDGLTGEQTQPAMGAYDDSNDFGFYGYFNTDLGDAPNDNYKTTRAVDGPRHILFPDTDNNGEPESYGGEPAIWLGLKVDSEIDGQASATANGDNIADWNDEDGVDLVDSTNWFEGESGGTIRVDLSSSENASNSGYLMVWFDWNHNGVFDPDELVVSETVTWTGFSDTQEFTFDIPVGIPEGGTDSALGADLIYRARLFTTAPTNLDTAMTGLTLNGEVEDYYAPVNTLPVTMNYFFAYRRGDTLVVDWSTGSEMGNVGFNILYKTEAGVQKLNETLIPATGISTHVPQDYLIEFNNFDWEQSGSFFLQDVDILGRVKAHGPFTLSVENGLRIVPEVTDWDAITTENDTQQLERNEINSSFVNDQLIAWLDSAVVTVEEQVYQTDRNDVSYPFKMYLPMVLGGKGGTEPPPPPPPVTDVVRIGDLFVDQTGIYRLTYEDLLAAGLNLSGQSSAEIALTSSGMPVPILIAGGSTFGEGSYIEFYGEALDTLYTTTNVYTLWIDPSNARRVSLDNTQYNPSLSPSPYYIETETVDVNQVYDPLTTWIDPWFNSMMLVTSAPKNWNYPIVVDNVFAGVEPVFLTVTVYGATDFRNELPDHSYRLKFNTEPVAERIFDGAGIDIVEAQLPAGTLIDGENTLNIELPADTGQAGEIIYLDTYSVAYPREFWAKNGALNFTSDALSFQVDNLLDASIVVYRLQNGTLSKVNDLMIIDQGGSYSVRFNGSGSLANYYIFGSSALLKPEIQPASPAVDITQGSAEYLVVAHPNFIDGLAPLIDARRLQGLTVKVVDVMDIYDQFGYGIFDPQAIKDYITFAWQNLGTRYVLLVGDDTYDYHGYKENGAISFIPSLYAPAGDFVQYTPVDPKYVDFDGDNVPDLPIGRFAVRTAAELDNMVAKTLAYDTKNYLNTSVFAADRNYSDESDALIYQLAEDWDTARAYIDFVGAESANTALIDQINQGVALTSFVGHSDDWQWTWEGLFDIYDWASLTNINQPTLMTQNGCWNVYYLQSDYETLSDMMLNRGLTGAAAMFGSTTLTSDLNEQRMGDYFMPLLTQPGMTIGDALTLAKQQLALEDINTLDVLIGWTLLGDPYLMVVP